MLAIPPLDPPVVDPAPVVDPMPVVVGLPVDAVAVVLPDALAAPVVDEPSPVDAAVVPLPGPVADSVAAPVAVPPLDPVDAVVAFVADPGPGPKLVLDDSTPWAQAVPHNSHS
ncbi:MAG: hypothetical protein D6705_00130 [Deltaproteobacteria bacterium]|nr:MAG: hypothetical protein D6705_00130 [Deltaproteobacteria bacterium]